MPTRPPITEARARQLAEIFARTMHPHRLVILAAAAEADAPGLSPIGYTATVDEPVNKVAYHFRTLATAGLIEAVDTGRRRGAVITFYRPTPAGAKLLRDLAALDAG